MNFLPTVQVGSMLASLTISVLIAGRNCNDPKPATRANFIPTLVVPLLLITHGLAFRILLQHQPEPTIQESRRAA